MATWTHTVGKPAELRTKTQKKNRKRKKWRAQFVLCSHSNKISPSAMKFDIFMDPWWLCWPPKFFQRATIWPIFPLSCTQEIKAATDDYFSEYSISYFVYKMSENGEKCRSRRPQMSHFVHNPKILMLLFMRSRGSRKYWHLRSWNQRIKKKCSWKMVQTI